MAGTFVINGDGTITVAFSYTALAEIVQATADAAAHWLYDADRYVLLGSYGIPVPWEELTNSDKLDMLDKFVLELLRNRAMDYLHNARVADARAYREEDEEMIL